MPLIYLIVWSDDLPMNQDEDNIYSSVFTFLLCYVFSKSKINYVKVNFNFIENTGN